MFRWLSFALTTGTLAASVACDNPASDKPRAEVTDPAKTAAPGAAQPGNAETLAITPSNSSIGFVGAKVTGSHTGSFRSFSGTAQLADGRAEGGKVTVDIELASVETDTPKLTRHLKSADFFDVDRFPKARFESTSITPGGAAGATHTVTGNLDLHGVKKSISFPAHVSVSPQEARLKSEFALNRKDFAIVYPGMPDDLIRDDVALKLDLRLPRKPGS